MVLKPKYFIVYIKRDDIYEDIAKMLQKMLKLNLILKIMNWNAIPLIDHCLKEN